MLVNLQSRRVGRNRDALDGELLYYHYMKKSLILIIGILIFIITFVYSRKLFLVGLSTKDPYVSIGTPEAKPIQPVIKDNAIIKWTGEWDYCLKGFDYYNNPVLPVTYTCKPGQMLEGYYALSVDKNNKNVSFFYSRSAPSKDFPFGDASSNREKVKILLFTKGHIFRDMCGIKTILSNINYDKQAFDITINKDNSLCPGTL
jgi:hypothetical protein